MKDVHDGSRPSEAGPGNGEGRYALTPAAQRALRGPSEGSLPSRAIGASSDDAVADQAGTVSSETGPAVDRCQVSPKVKTACQGIGARGFEPPATERPDAGRTVDYRAVDTKEGNDDAGQDKLAAGLDRDQVSHRTDKGRAGLSRFQGDLGEGVALRVGTERLGLTPDLRFDQPYQGFDVVSHDPQGKLVVVESKFDERGIKALRRDQMQPRWIRAEAIRMQDRDSAAWTEGNAEIGAEIEAAGADQVRRIVISTNPQTLVSSAYEGRTDGGWRKLGQWRVIDLDQPHLSSRDGVSS